MSRSSIVWKDAGDLASGDRVWHPDEEALVTITKFLRHGRFLEFEARTDRGKKVTFETPEAGDVEVYR
jgi:hypothetical protein